MFTRGTRFWHTAICLVPTWVPEVWNLLLGSRRNLLGMDRNGMWLPRLPGHDDYIGRSLALLKPGGRFVEIGKRGIWSHQQILSSTGHSSWAMNISYSPEPCCRLGPWMSWITALLRMFEARSSPEIGRASGKVCARSISLLLSVDVTFRSLAYNEHICHYQVPSGNLT